MNPIEISALGGLCVAAMLMIRLAMKYRALKAQHNVLKKTYDVLRPRMRQELEEDYSRKLRIETDRRVNDFAAALSQENVHLLSQALTSKEGKKWAKHTQDILEKLFGKMTQEFLGSLTDEGEGLARDVQFSLSEKLWDSMQQMKEKQDDSPYLLPRNARIAYTKGTRTVVLIEQAPQVRTMEFTSQIVTGPEMEEAVSRDDGIYRFVLAFPYVYFFMVFNSGKFNHMQVFFGNKSLESCKDVVGFAPLPNIHRNPSDGFSPTYSPMCMGVDFFLNKSQDINIQCDHVISHFWQAPFSGHLGKFGIDKNKLDERISDYGRWQKESAENPLFVLTVKWPNHLTVKGVVEGMLSKNREKHALNSLETQIKRLLDDGVKKITTRVKEEIEMAQQKYTVKSETLAAQIQQDVETTLTSHADKVFAACRKQL